MKTYTLEEIQIKASKQNLILLGNDLFVSTAFLAKQYEMKHENLRAIVIKYKCEFEEFGEIIETKEEFIFPVHGKNKKEKRGRKSVYFLLNEPQFTFLVMMLKPDVKIVKHKTLLNKEFWKLRKMVNSLIVAKQNEEWRQKRAAGKIERRVETDIIKKFIEYATAQGSTNASNYYMAITKMENTGLFHLEYMKQDWKNLRNIVNGFGLDALKMGDHIIGRAIYDGMEKRLHYKDIFQLAKARFESFADSIGKMQIGSRQTLEYPQQIKRLG